MTWSLVESDAELTRVLEELAGCADLAVDTEFMRRDTYYPQIALLQVCGGEHAYLIDPLKIDDLDGLRSLLTDPSVTKVLHSCSEDLEVFRRWLDVLPSPLVDTQRAAGLLGEAFGLGYRALVEALLGVALDKGETRSDWLRRPLSESQCHYAAQDVLLLLPAWRQLRERAEKDGRMAWVLEEGEDALAALAARETEIFRRIKGSGRLTARELEILRRLCDWREARARSLDRPRGWVLDDKACLAIARSAPTSMPALGAIDGLPPAVVRRQGEALLELVEAALETPATDLPAPAPRPLAAEQRARLKDLREALRAVAEDLRIAPEAALAGSDLELLVREAQGESIAAPRRWSGWRSGQVIEPLRRVLRDAA